MSTNETDLKKHTQSRDVEGLTIRKFFLTLDKLAANANAVMVFDDDSWCELFVDDDDGERIRIFDGPNPITNVLTPRELLAARLLTPAQFEILIEKQNAKKLSDNAKQIAYHQRELDRLIKQASPTPNGA